jgi:hypothetical protein
MTVIDKERKTNSRRAENDWEKKARQQRRSVKRRLIYEMKGTIRIHHVVLECSEKFAPSLKLVSYKFSSLVCKEHFLFF